MRLPRFQQICRAGALAAVAFASGCAEKVPPPVLFVDSPEFIAVQPTAYGVLHGDPMSVVVEKVEGGFRAVRYLRGEDTLWKRDCEGSVLGGDELDALRWLPMAS